MRNTMPRGGGEREREGGGASDLRNLRSRISPLLWLVYSTTVSALTHIKSLLVRSFPADGIKDLEMENLKIHKVFIK
jgi:hypothetical protein